MDHAEHMMLAFREQARFAAGYSPLYRAIFEIVAGWLADRPDDPLVVWLAAVTRERAPFDVTLLLPAALHRAILAGDPAAAALARFFPTAGGPAEIPDRPQFELTLRNTLLQLRETLLSFLQTANVQTNETARGLAWLWPLAQTGWSEVHLLELGASAGLNLLADRRTYQLMDVTGAGQALLQLGQADAVPFRTAATGWELVPDSKSSLPRIATRTGVDARPFLLNTREDELTLASFVWGDQPERLRRLGEGITVLRAFEAAGESLKLDELSLPDELAGFLATWQPAPVGRPLVVFNTTVTMYLAGGSAGLAGPLGQWARQQAVPVLWLQWEPGSVDQGAPPEPGWLAWTADLWSSGRHESYHLAWVHPHAAALHWLPGAREWLEFCTREPRFAQIS